MEKQLIHKIFCRVGRSVSPRCAYGHRACAIERLYARTHARAIAGSRACAHVHLARAQTRASLQIKFRACWRFAFVARRLFSIRCARFFFFRDICRQRTSSSSRCFVFFFKLDKRSEERGSRSKAIRIYGFLILFFFLWSSTVFENGTKFDTLYFKTGGKVEIMKI